MYPAREHRVRILFFGDIVGSPGRKALAEVLPRWREAHQPDLIIANAENAAGGMGITPHVAEEIFSYGVQVITLGNHTFNKKEAVRLLEDNPRVLRPLNYPPGVPGHGYGVFSAAGVEVAVVSLMGRIFMDPIDDPFQQARTLVPLLRQRTPCILIDIHAEATSEKAAIAWMLDGQVSAVIGTHTHVATADARVLPAGTAFITDVGMVGPLNSILGVKQEIIVTRFLNWMPARFEVAGGPATVNAVLIEIQAATGLTEQIIHLQEVVNLTTTDL